MSQNFWNSPYVGQTQLDLQSRVVSEAEASGGVRHVVSPTLPFPSTFPFSDKPVGGKVRSSEGEVHRLLSTNTNLPQSQSDEIWHSQDKLGIWKLFAEVVNCHYLLEHART